MEEYCEQMRRYRQQLETAFRRTRSNNAGNIYDWFADTIERLHMKLTFDEFRELYHLACDLEIRATQDMKDLATKENYNIIALPLHQE